MSGESRSPANERKLAAALEELAARDPQRALALAGEERNLVVRQKLREAALRGWASIAPDAALAWAMTLHDADNRPAIEAVLTGAAQKPAEAVRIATQLCANDPALAPDYGQLLISALTEVGAFETATQFAANGTAANRTAWLNSAFNQWARHQPEQALAAIQGIADPGLRQEALQGLFFGCAQSNPAALVEYAMRLPAQEDRAAALGPALTQCVSLDPAAAAELLNHLEPRPELDQGTAALALIPALVAQHPEVAVSWAEGITDPAMRAATLSDIGRQWAEKDSVSARLFVDTNATLGDADRNALRRGLRGDSDAVSPPAPNP